jgi:hypothetical protein
MMRIVLALLFSFKIVFANSTCRDAGLNINKFMDASVGQMLVISKMKIAPEAQNQKLEELIASCVSVDKVSKRVLGRAKWATLNKAQQDNFLKEYPKYFVKVFREVTVSTLSSIQSYSFRRGAMDNTYDVTFIPLNKNTNPFILTLTIEPQGEYLEITNGEAFNVSILNSQRQMFDRLNDQNPNIIKTFNAESFPRQSSNK